MTAPHGRNVLFVVIILFVVLSTSFAELIVEQTGMA